MRALNAGAEGLAALFAALCRSVIAATHDLQIFWHDWTIALLEQQRDRVNQGLADTYLARSQAILARNAREQS